MKVIKLVWLSLTLLSPSHSLSVLAAPGDILTITHKGVLTAQRGLMTRLLAGLAWRKLRAISAQCLNARWRTAVLATPTTHTRILD